VVYGGHVVSMEAILEVFERYLGILEEEI